VDEKVKNTTTSTKQQNNKANINILARAGIEPRTSGTPDN